MLTTRITVLADASPIRPRQRVRLHVGTSEVLARVLPLDRETIAPGEIAWAQLRLEAPVLARAGDRFVLRAYSPVRTIAGGVLIEYDAPRRKRLASEEAGLLQQLLEPDHAIEALVALRAAAGAPIPQLPVLTGLPPHRVKALLGTAGDVFNAGDRLYPAHLATAARERMLEAVATAHAHRPLDPGLPLAELRRAAAPLPAALAERIIRDLVEAGQLVARGAAYALPGFAPAIGAAHAPLADALLAAYRDAALEPPRLTELPADMRAHSDLEPVLRILVEQGRLIALAAGLYADSGAITAAAERLSREFPEPARATTGMLKQALGLPRKHLIPLLEFFDRVGVTRREGEERMVRGSAVVASGKEG